MKEFEFPVVEVKIIVTEEITDLTGGSTGTGGEDFGDL